MQFLVPKCHFSHNKRATWWIKKLENAVRLFYPGSTSHENFTGIGKSIYAETKHRMAGFDPPVNVELITDTMNWCDREIASG